MPENSPSPTALVSWRNGEAPWRFGGASEASGPWPDPCRARPGGGRWSCDVMSHDSRDLSLMSLSLCLLRF